MNSIQINTSQNVNIQFQLASIGERMLAFTIDLFIKIAYFFVVYLILFKLFDFRKIFFGMDPWSIRAIWVIISLPTIFYTLAFESLTEGQTPGKRILKTKVVKTDGYQATFPDYLTRWYFRIIDIDLSSAVVGLVSMIINKDTKRLGDIAAGTAVISLKNKFNINHTILVDLQADYRPVFSQVVALSDNDMRIIVEHFNKAKVERNTRVLRKLVEKITETTGIIYRQEEYRRVQFIEQIIRDYNYFTGKVK